MLFRSGGSHEDSKSGLFRYSISQSGRWGMCWISGGSSTWERKQDGKFICRMMASDNVGEGQGADDWGEAEMEKLGKP